MGKINKNANLYYKFGEDRKVSKNKYGKYELANVTMEELETMIDEYPKDGDALALDHMKMALFEMYRKYGNPHEKELIERIKAEAEKKASTEEVKQALETVASNMDIRREASTADVEQSEDTNEHESADVNNADGQRVDGNDTIMDEYVDFEEVKGDVL